MDEFINRQEAIEAVCGCVPHSCDIGSCGFACSEANALSKLPAADVRPVVRGKWEVGGMFDDIGRCSNCHYMFPIDTAMTEFHFCPNCGADMREES